MRRGSGDGWGEGVQWKRHLCTVVCQENLKKKKPLFNAKGTPTAKKICVAIHLGGIRSASGGECKSSTGETTTFKKHENKTKYAAHRRR